TGVGWRNIIEKMHMTATLTKWYEEHGRHEIFAGNKSVPMSSKEHSLTLVAEHVNAERQHDLDDLGIAKNAREEKKRARDEAMKKKAENDRMMRLYKEHVLGQKIPENFVPLDGLITPAPAKPAAAEETREEVGAMGD
ncbi:MAG: radical SAM protein, partial [Bryobacteraceae bacterium]